jgi:hypothetical protein
MRGFLFAVFTSVSIIPLHIVGFSIYLPPPLRGLLSVSFQAELAFRFFLVSAVGFFIARYVPILLIAVEIHLRALAIGRAYKRRGYKRASPVLNRIYDGAASSMDVGSRFDARLENFIKRKVRSASSLMEYEKYKVLISIGFALVLISIGYVGFVRASLVFLLFLVLGLLVGIYEDYRDSSFWRLTNVVYGATQHGQSTFSFNFSRLPAIFVIIAILSGSLGYLRCSYLASKESFFALLKPENRKVSVLARTSSGVVFVDQGGLFGFMPNEDVRLDVVP